MSVWKDEHLKIKDSYLTFGIFKHPVLKGGNVDDYWEELQKQIVLLVHRRFRAVCLPHSRHSTTQVSHKTVAAVRLYEPKCHSSEN